ncbi:hypothetical protein GOP47_0012539 [Adiantum capillus-veneris]|uniref:PRONE domain-containing protein n=1 Tax=Adiantum capillus-veneris TaxID=13818 RepID=A0A9D4UQW0_ADICA|nr:hypothetical protein GOP47_0012539 [Adiantum capillus-veneris]
MEMAFEDGLIKGVVKCGRGVLMRRLLACYDGWSSGEQGYEWDTVQDAMQTLTQTHSRIMEMYHRDVDAMQMEGKRPRKVLEGKKTNMEDELHWQEQVITRFFENVSLMHDKLAKEAAQAKEEVNTNASCGDEMRGDDDQFFEVEMEEQYLAEKLNAMFPSEGVILDDGGNMDVDTCGNSYASRDEELMACKPDVLSEDCSSESHVDERPTGPVPLLYPCVWGVQECTGTLNSEKADTPRTVESNEEVLEERQVGPDDSHPSHDWGTQAYAEMCDSKTKDRLVSGEKISGVLELWEDMAEQDVRSEMVDVLLGYETGSLYSERGILPESVERLETSMTRSEPGVRPDASKEVGIRLKSPDPNQSNKEQLELLGKMPDIYGRLSLLVSKTIGQAKTGTETALLRIDVRKGVLTFDKGSLGVGTVTPRGQLCGKDKGQGSLVWDPGEGTQRQDAFEYGMTHMCGGAELTTQWNALGRCKAKLAELEPLADFSRLIVGRRLPGNKERNWMVNDVPGGQRATKMCGEICGHEWDSMLGQEKDGRWIPHRQRGMSNEWEHYMSARGNNQCGRGQITMIRRCTKRDGKIFGDYCEPGVVSLKDAREEEIVDVMQEPYYKRASSGEHQPAFHSSCFVWRVNWARFTTARCEVDDDNGYAWGHQLSGIARLNQHMQKVHGWQILYPKLNVGKHLPSEIETWSAICNKWRSGFCGFLELPSIDANHDCNILEMVNRVEAATQTWCRKLQTRQSQVNAKVKTLLLLLKQKFPGILDMSKNQYNKDVGQSIKSYSRVLKSLAFNVLSRMFLQIYMYDALRVRV